MECRRSSIPPPLNSKYTSNTLVLPCFENAITTRNICITGLLAIWRVPLGCLTFAGYSLYVRRTWQASLWTLLHSLGEALPLTFNIAITLVTNCIGYICWNYGTVGIPTRLRLLGELTRRGSLSVSGEAPGNRVVQI
jgi:hypothetical protein